MANGFRKLQVVLYMHVLKALKWKGELYFDALDLIDNTDQFWTHQFDEVYTEARKPSKGRKGFLEEEVYYCLDEIVANMTDYYSNAMNHHPGYKPGVKFNDHFNWTDRELVKLAKIVRPLAK